MWLTILCMCCHFSHSCFECHTVHKHWVGTWSTRHVRTSQQGWVRFKRFIYAKRTFFSSMQNIQWKHVFIPVRNVLLFPVHGTFYKLKRWSRSVLSFDHRDTASKDFECGTCFKLKGKSKIRRRRSVGWQDSTPRGCRCCVRCPVWCGDCCVDFSKCLFRAQHYSSKIALYHTLPTCWYLVKLILFSLCLSQRCHKWLCSRNRVLPSWVGPSYGICSSRMLAASLLCFGVFRVQNMHRCEQEDHQRFVSDWSFLQRPNELLPCRSRYTFVLLAAPGVARARGPKADWTPEVVFARRDTHRVSGLLMSPATLGCPPHRTPIECIEQPVGRRDSSEPHGLRKVSLLMQ